jgi:DNA repair protein RadC
MLTPVVPNVTPSTFPAPFDDHEEQLVRQAIVLLEQRLFQRGPSLSHPGATRQYLQLQLAASPNEVFAAVFLDAQHRVLAFECLFQGSIDCSAVYPRVILQRTLAWNAAAVIFSHYVAHHIMAVMCREALCSGGGPPRRFH